MTTILVVDDDDDLRHIVTSALAAFVQVIEAVHGRAALDLLDDGATPDLILLDMNMPVMNGWDFAAELKRRGGPHPPIIVLTAAHDAARSAEAIGAVDYLGKPFLLQDLFDVVSRTTSSALDVATVGPRGASRDDDSQNRV